MHKQVWTETKQTSNAWNEMQVINEGDVSHDPAMQCASSSVTRIGWLAESRVSCSAKLPLVHGKVDASLTRTSIHPDGTKRGSISNNRNMIWGNTILLWASVSLVVGEAADAHAERGGLDIPVLFQVVGQVINRPWQVSVYIVHSAVRCQLNFK